jgi:hypothetical protein
MKPVANSSGRCLAYSAIFLVIARAVLVTKGWAADFNVTTPGSFFQFNSTSNNPTLTLVRGNTYTFALNTAPFFHPFFIGTSVGSGVAPAGVSGANGSQNGTGTITFAVPANATDCAYYCPNHFFSGNIVMVDPPAPTPPSIQIFNLKVTTNLAISSTVSSTNGYTLTPEFNTNLATANWSSLTVQSNKFLNGTNEIICGKPEANAVFLRIRAQQN